jgi:glycosyltransferase involved in cell wall biosynthesis
MQVSVSISIVVPVYNSAAFLEQSVGSLLAQTHRNIEVILVNDGSPDNSGAMCDQFAASDSRVRVIHQQNQGAAAALNAGMEAAMGEYLMFLDADDWLHPDTCTLALEAANRSGADLVFWPFIKEFEGYSQPERPVFSEETIFEGEKMVFFRRRMIGLLGAELADPIRTDAFNAGWGKLYKKQLFGNNIRWTNTYEVGSSDVLFNIQTSIFVQKAHFIPHFLMHYRQGNPHSLTKNYKFTLLEKYLRLFDKIQNHIQQYYLGSTFQTALDNRICVSIINIALSITSPNIEVSHRQRIRHLSQALHQPLYVAKLSQFDRQYLPLHWKVFFFSCKMQWSPVVYALALVMRRFR